jgi:hypothetical protein
MLSSHPVHDDVMARKLGVILTWQAVACLVMIGCSSAESTRSEGTAPPAAIDPPAVEAPEPTEAAGPPSDAVSRLIRQALRSDGSVSYASLQRQLGPPRRVEKRPVPNQYVEGQVDTLRTLVYTGLRALVYDVTDTTKTFLVRLSLSSTQYATPEGLRVGLSEQQVLDQLGPPTRRNASVGELIYQETEPTPTSMVVRIREGRVVQIDWEFYFA